MDFDDPYDPPASLSEPTLRLWNLVRFGAHDRSALELVRQAAADGADLCARNRFSVSPLILAIKFDAPDSPMTKLLLELGAPIGSESQKGSAMAAASRLLDGGAASRLLSEEAARRLALKERDALSQCAPPAPSKAAPRV